jgi:hypothetical protein
LVAQESSPGWDTWGLLSVTSNGWIQPSVQDCVLFCNATPHFVRGYVQLSGKRRVSVARPRRGRTTVCRRGPVANQVLYPLDQLRVVTHEDRQFAIGNSAYGVADGACAKGASRRADMRAKSGLDFAFAQVVAKAWPSKADTPTDGPA